MKNFQSFSQFLKNTSTLQEVLGHATSQMAERNIHFVSTEKMPCDKPLSRQVECFGGEIK